jgi:hypothetical protein
MDAGRNMPDNLRSMCGEPWRENPGGKCAPIQQQQGNPQIHVRIMRSTRLSAGC